MAAIRAPHMLRCLPKSSQCLFSPRMGPQIYPSLQNSRRAFSVSGRICEKRYTEEHEWIELEGEADVGKIGISTYAAKALGDVVYVELPQPNTEVAKGDTIGAVESVKSASDIMTPVAGKIVEANNTLEEKPATINKSPEDEGWIAKIEIGSKVEIDSLMDKQAYDSFTGDKDASEKE